MITFKTRWLQDDIASLYVCHEGDASGGGGGGGAPGSIALDPIDIHMSQPDLPSADDAGPGEANAGFGIGSGYELGNGSGFGFAGGDGFGGMGAFDIGTGFDTTGLSVRDTRGYFDPRTMSVVHPNTEPFSIMEAPNPWAPAQFQHPRIDPRFVGLVEATEAQNAAAFARGVENAIATQGLSRAQMGPSFTNNPRGRNDIEPTLFNAQNPFRGGPNPNFDPNTAMFDSPNRGLPGQQRDLVESHQAAQNMRDLMAQRGMDPGVSPQTIELVTAQPRPGGFPSASPDFSTLAGMPGFGRAPARGPDLTGMFGKEQLGFPMIENEFPDVEFPDLEPAQVATALAQRDHPGMTKGLDPVQSMPTQQTLDMFNVAQSINPRGFPSWGLDVDLPDFDFPGKDVATLNNRGIDQFNRDMQVGQPLEIGISKVGQIDVPSREPVGLIGRDMPDLPVGGFDRGDLGGRDFGFFGGFNDDHTPFRLKQRKYGGRTGGMGSVIANLSRMRRG